MGSPEQKMKKKPFDVMPASYKKKLPFFSASQQTFGTYRVGNKFSDTLNVPFVSNYFISVKIAVNSKF